MILETIPYTTILVGIFIAINLIIAILKAFKVKFSDTTERGIAFLEILYVLLIILTIVFGWK